MQKLIIEALVKVILRKLFNVVGVLQIELIKLNVDTCKLLYYLFKEIVNVKFSNEM